MTEPSRYADPQAFLDPSRHFAVVDASNDKAQEGFHIYAALQMAGFQISPINPRERTIQGDVCFPDLRQLRPFADAVIFTIPPEENPNRGFDILKEMRDNGIHRIWIEPDCATPEMLKFSAEYHFEVVSGYALRNELLKKKTEENSGF